jgi:hypothetical protein
MTITKLKPYSKPWAGLWIQPPELMKESLAGFLAPRKLLRAVKPPCLCKKDGVSTSWNSRLPATLLLFNECNYPFFVGSFLPSNAFSATLSIPAYIVLISDNMKKADG